MVQRDGDRIRLIDTVKYLSGQAAIAPQSLRLLDQLARLLCADTAIRVEVGVHTDSRGSSSYNLALSEKRAVAVRAYLARRGIAPQRVRAKGYGETVPISHGPPRHRRRTEIKVLTP